MSHKAELPWAFASGGLESLASSCSVPMMAATLISVHSYLLVIGVTEEDMSAGSSFPLLDGALYFRQNLADFVERNKSLP